MKRYVYISDKKCIPQLYIDIKSNIICELYIYTDYFDFIVHPYHMTLTYVNYFHGIGDFKSNIPVISDICNSPFSKFVYLIFNTMFFFLRIIVITFA
jgi:hypothetical protein